MNTDEAGNAEKLDIEVRIDADPIRLTLIMSLAQGWYAGPNSLNGKRLPVDQIIDDADKLLTCVVNRLVDESAIMRGVPVSDDSMKAHLVVGHVAGNPEGGDSEPEYENGTPPSGSPGSAIVDDDSTAAPKTQPSDTEDSEPANDSNEANAENKPLTV